MSEHILRTLRVETCQFCRELQEGLADAFTIRYSNQLQDRSILRNSYFSVFPSLGQLTEGHVLISPFEHYTAMADLPLSMLSMLEEVCSIIRSALVSIYGKCVFFEHGTRTENCGGCGIYHAHMHALPIPGVATLEVLKQQFPPHSVPRLRELPGCLPPGCSYLYFQDENARAAAFPVDNIPSQYVRRVLAAQIGKDSWDWKSTWAEPEFIATYHRLSAHLSRTQGSWCNTPQQRELVAVDGEKVPENHSSAAQDACSQAEGPDSSAGQIQIIAE